MSAHIHERIRSGPFILLIVSFLFVNFLFFIDEGWYDLRWMKQPGNWLAFALYLGILFGSQMIFHTWICCRLQRSDRIVLSAIGGVVLLFIVVFAIWGIAA